MRTVDMLCTTALETQLKSLRSQFTAAGLIVRKTKAVKAENLADAITDKRGANGFDIFIVVGNQAETVNVEIRNAMSEQCFDRYYGAEAVLRGNESPFAQCFVGQSDNAMYIACPHGVSFLQNLMTLLQMAKTPPENLSESDSQIHMPIIEDDFEDDRSTLVERIRVESPLGSVETLTETQEKGWKSTILAMGAVISNDSWASIPVELMNIAPAKNVLETAGNRKTIRFLSSGKEYALFGFPSLDHPNCKALLIGSGKPFAEIIAIHRAPKRIGLLSETGCGWLPSPSTPLKKLGESKFGVLAEPDGKAFAIDSKSIFYLKNNKVYMWDGKNENQWGTTKQAIASLLLQWSQR